jgi:L-aminopeptidase/D-esterase-like protein
VVAAHYKKDDLLNCLTSSSDISGYHPDFHEGQGTVGAGQERGMACVNQQHGMGMACYV